MRLAFAVGVLAAIAVPGCALDGQVPDESLGSSQEEIESDNLLSSNLLSSNLLSLNLLSSNLLSSNLLSSNSLVLNQSASNGLEKTGPGRELLKYVARCALPSGISLQVTVNNQTYVFPGLIGLAPNWWRWGLSLDERRLVSACLLAHSNAYGVSVPISVRSKNALAFTSWIESWDYPVFEAAFYGNLFDGNFEAYACLGESLAQATAESSWRSKRACADAVAPGNKSRCNFTVPAPCSQVCAVDFWSGYERDCYTGAGRTGTRYAEPISVYLQATH